MFYKNVPNIDLSFFLKITPKLWEGISKSSLAGNRLTEEYSNIIQKEKKIQINPHYKLKGKKLLSNPPNVTPSYQKYRVNVSNS